MATNNSASRKARRKGEVRRRGRGGIFSHIDPQSVTVNASGKVLRARALKPYSGDSTSVEGAPVSDANSFISFSAGDVLVITDKSKADWWLGHIEGIFPPPLSPFLPTPLLSPLSIPSPLLPSYINWMSRANEHMGMVSNRSR